ncbi:hypothetical protein IW262DRAFT_1469460 [Armillaria fumosa]|nr:hypothetical protein IW262DRAFT_1469460 [Armillaria fumosa]
MANITMSNCPVPTENPIILDLTSSYGSFLVGSWLACAMWGMSSLQVFIYYMNSSNVDLLFLRILVCSGMAFDTNNGILILKGQWHVLIHQYGRIEGLEETPLELLHHLWVETIVITLLEVVVFVYLINVYGKPLEVISTPLIVGFNISYLSASVAVDVVVSFSMIFLLTQTGTPTIPKTMRMVYHLIMVIVLSGTFTSLTATVALVLVKVYPTALYYTIVEFSLCSLYFSTLLANLNARTYIQSPDGRMTISSFGTARRSRNNETFALGSLTHPYNGASSVGAATDGGIQIPKERDVRADNPDMFLSLKDQCTANSS